MHITTTLLHAVVYFLANPFSCPRLQNANAYQVGKNIFWQEYGGADVPVEVQSQNGIQLLPEDVFKEISYAVTGITFEIHNRYGRYFGEKIYKYELAAECTKRGMPGVEIEVPIRVSLQNFAKCYYMDLLINRGALFELKVMEALNEEHVNQMTDN